MVTYVSGMIHAMCIAAVHAWLGGQVIENAKAFCDSATFYVRPNDTRCWPIALDGKMVRVRLELVDNDAIPMVNEAPRGRRSGRSGRKRW